MVLDTNILIAYLNGDLRVVAEVDGWFANNRALFISAVTYAEILALPEAGPSDLVTMKEFLGSFVLIDIDRTIAEETASIKRKYKLKFPDAAIVATAIHTKSALVTRDRKLHKVSAITTLEL